MSYKGYKAKIEFDERDNIFVGRVLNTSAIISFHGDTIEQCKLNFIRRLIFVLSRTFIKKESFCARRNHNILGFKQ
jgi:predicted HicB family RNase H-like nuclease